MKRNYLLSLMLSLLCLMAWADRIDLQVAKEIAQTVAKGYNTGALRTSSQPPTLVYAAAAGQEGSVLRSGTTTTDVDYYIFNIGSQHGFIIVAGEDRAHPVLGFSDTGTFDPDHIPSNLRGMLAFYQKEIDYAVRTNLEASETIRSEWNRLTSGLSLRAESAEVILHTAKWDQGAPYNSHTPMEGSEHTLTGCVATSTGILLQYCQYPVQLENGVSAYYGIPISYRPYNWELMPQDQPDTDTEIEEVSTLLWHIGANVEMDYGLYGSSAVNMKAVEFLQNNAQFNKGTRYLEREDFYWDEWKNMIRRTLNGQEYGQGYPLLYRGSGNAGGHMFIIDGYGPEEYFHVNWGWGGNSDGNFVLTALNTNSGNFSEECGMIYAAVPQTELDKDDIELRFRSLVLSGKVEPSAPFSVKFRCINTGNVRANYFAGVGVYDKDGNLKSTIHQDSYYCDLKSNYLTTFGLTCNISESLSSTDQIVPIYKVTESDPEWHRMPNAPAAPLYINGIGEYISDTDTPTDPTLIPINHYYNRQTDCYIKVENGLDGILYNSSQTISLNMTGQRGNKTMRYKIKDYDGWKDHVRAFYSNRNFYNSSQGTELSISEDGIFTIAINESEYDDAFMSYLMVCSDQRGVLNYELNITDDNTGSAQYSLLDGTMHIVQEMVITPSDIAGNVNSEIPFTVNITNIDPALYGKQMGATIGLSNAANRGIVVKYDGTIVNCQQQDDDLYGDFIVSTLPAESTHTLNFTIQSTETLTSDDNVTVFVYSHQYPSDSYSTPVIISAAETVYRQVTTTWTNMTCDWTGTQVEDGSQLVLHITPDEGYDLPEKVTVSMGGVELTNVYDRIAGTITIENVTADLNITATAVRKQYTVKFTLQNIQPIEDKSVSHGGMVMVILKAATNYKLPTSITVKQGETILERGEDYLYSVLLGNMANLHLKSVKGDIEVIAVGVPKNSYEVAMSLDHLTTGSEINNIVGGEPINCKLTPATGYRLPATIEIKMGETTLTAGTEYTYSPESGEISIPNVTGAIQITAAAELITFTINQDLNGLSLTPDPEPIGYGGTYEGTLSLTDPENNKLPVNITVKQSNGDESWTDYTYDPSTGKVTIQNLTAELIIQASSVLLNDYSISTVLDHISVSGLPEGNTIKEGKKLTLNLTAEEDYKLPNTIQIKQDGEALSADTYTYDATTGEVVIQQVKGDITILASGIDQHNYEVELHLTNITSTLDNNSFLVNTQVEFTLNANTGYTLPSELTVTMGGTALAADVDYSYNPANGQFSLRAITGPLSITAMAVPNNYGAATYQLSRITLGGYTEHAVYGTIYECQLTADEGYELPASIQIEMAGALLETGYTYENGLIRILSVTGPITIKAEATLKSYAVTAELSHLGSDLTADKKVRHGESLTVQLQAAEEYKLPASVTVKMSDTPLTSDAFSYDPTNGIIQITAVTGPVEITASGLLKVSYTVTTDLNNVSADIESGHSILEGSSLTIHLTVEEGFELPSSVTLQQGEKTLIEGNDYTYDKSSGDLVINSVQGNLTLTVHGIDTRHYEVLLTITGLNTDPAVIAPILHGEKLVFKLVAAEGYRLPKTLASVKAGDTPVSADDYTYNATTGEFQMNDITQKVSIEAIGQRIYYSVNATLQDLNSDLTEDQKVAHGESLRISFSVDESFVLPKSVTVKMGGETLTTGFTYENGVLTITAVKGNIEVIASALKKVIVTEETEELEGEIPSIEVKTDGNVELTLGDIVNDHLEVGSNSEANIKVTADSKIDELKNVGTATLSSNGSSKLKLQTIDNSGILVLDESLKLESVPETVSNSGSFTDNTGTIKKVEGSAALELTVTPPSQNTYTQGQRFTLTVKATVSTSRQKTVFEWQKKRNYNWERVQADERSLSLRSDAVEELTSTYTLPQNDQGDYRCVVSNVVDAEKQTTLLTETAVSLRTSDPGPEPEPDPTPTPNPDPEPDPTPVPDPIPTPDPTPTFKVTIPQVEGTSVHTYGSSYVEKGKSFSFRINIAEGYNAKDLVVKANGAVLLPDASGLYVIGDIQDNVVVTITGIVKESPSANEGPGYTMTSVWTAQGQIHIHLGQDATITVSDYNGRIVKRFKGTVGDYHISVPEGSYVVSVDGLTYKVVL